MSISRFRPLFRPLSRGFDEFFSSPFFRESVLDQMPVLSRNLDREGLTLLRSSPGYEINESDKQYQISVDVPGVKAADMLVNFEEDGQVLNISGGRKVTKEGATTETKFEKRFMIGDNVDVDKMTANLSDGVLTLTAPKLEKVEKPVKQIAITESPPLIKGDDDKKAA